MHCSEAIDMKLTKDQIDGLKRIDKVVSMRDGSADECHDYYCPYNIGMLVDHVAQKDPTHGSKYFIVQRPSETCRVDEGGNIHEEEHGLYHGKPDGFDSGCPRFLCIDRANGKWDCLCGLEVVARLLGVGHEELYEVLEPHFVKGHEILGYNQAWRKAGGSK